MADTDQTDAAAKTAKASRVKLITLLSLGLLAIIGGSVGATIYFVGGGSEAGPQAQAEVSSTPYYVELLDPKFSVNLAADSKSRFLKVSMSALTYDPEVDTAIRHHLPQLRSNLMLTLSSQRSQELGNRKGLEKLQQEVLKKVRQTLGQVGVKGKVESVYFTSFVSQ